MKLLHLRRIEAEILPAQGTHAHQFHLSLEDIDKHRELVQPAAPEAPAPEVHAVVVRELTAFLKSFMLQHVGLQILRIRIHGPELIYADHAAVVSHAVELHQGAACRVVVPDGGLDLPAQEEEFTLGEVLIDHLESGPVHAPEQFYPAVSAVRSLGYAHIEPTGDPQFRKHPMPQVVEGVDYFPRKTGIGAADNRPLEAGSPGMTPQEAVVHQGLIGLVQESVQMTDPVERPLVDNQAGMFFLQGLEIVPVVRVHDKGLGVQFVPMLVQPRVRLLEAQVFRKCVDPLDIHMRDELILQLRPGLFSRLGVVGRDVLGLMPKGHPRFAPVEKAHIRQGFSR